MKRLMMLMTLIGIMFLISCEKEEPVNPIIPELITSTYMIEVFGIHHLVWYSIDDSDTIKYVNGTYSSFALGGEKYFQAPNTSFYKEVDVKLYTKVYFLL